MNRPFVLAAVLLTGCGRADPPRRVVLDFASLPASPAAAPQRALLYPAEPTGNLKDAVDTVRDLKRPAPRYADLTATSDYYARVVARKYLFDKGGRLSPDAVLGGKPFVFFTTPQGLTGRSLLEILLDAGNEPAELLDPERREPLAAIVFRYPPAVGRWPDLNGTLPAAWEEAVYVPTWENAFALFGKLAKGATVGTAARPDPPRRLEFASEDERKFVLTFPRAGLDRIKDAKEPYEVLRRKGGPEWEYRRLLKDKLSLFPHFRGTGRTVNVVLDPDMAKPDTGVFEFVGPNSRLADLAEFAVVDLGSLTVADTYTSQAPPKP